MAKTKEKKQEIYQQYNDLIDTYQTIILLDTNSIKTKSVEKFKQNLEQSDSIYILLKNTIFSKALKEKKASIEVGVFGGPTAAVFSKEDPSAMLKNMLDFLNENKNVAIRSGVFENNLMDGKTIIEIAKLPAKPDMLAKTVGAIKSPLYSFVNVLSGVQKNFLYTLKAIEAKK